MPIDYDLLRSERKSIVINIERDGKVLVNAPLDLDEIEIVKYVYKKRCWIWEKLAIKKSATEEMYEKKFKKQEQDFQQKYNKLKDKINTLFNR